MTRKVLRGYIFSKTLLRSSGFSKALLRSSGRKILIGTVCLLVVVCLHPPVALAQHVGGGHAGGFGGGHFGGGGGHFGGGGHSGSGHSGGGAHASAPRHSTPAPSTPAATSGLRSSTTNSASFRPRPRPVPLPRPLPTPIVFIPVYYTSPFFFWGGFNSFGWPGCNPFWGFGCYSPFYGYGGYYGGYGSYYGGYYGNYAFGSFGGLGLDYGNGTGTYSSRIDSGQSTTPQTYVSPSYPTDTRARELVELFFKDGTVFNVTDYWLVDGQLHFLTVDERAEATVEHVAAFDSLDLQRTVDVNTERGFRFQLRGESMEQYLRNHPEVVPKVDPDAPHNQ